MMEPQVVTVPQRWVAYRSGSSKLDGLGRAIQELLGPIYALPGVSGTPYARYLECEDDLRNFEAGVLLREPVSGVGDITAKLMDPFEAVFVEFRGAYSDLGEAHRGCQEYLDAHSLDLAGPTWEVYDGPPNEEGIAKVLVYWPISSR